MRSPSRLRTRRAPSRRRVRAVAATDRRRGGARVHDDADKYQIRALGAESELKRFREREPLVQQLLACAASKDIREQATIFDAIEAIRDFKLTEVKP